LGLEPRLLLTEGFALLALALAGGLVARLEGVAHLLGERVDAGAQVVARGDGVALAVVEVGRPVEHRRVDPAAGQALLEDLPPGAQAPGVEHGGDGSVPRRAGHRSARARRALRLTGRRRSP